MVSNLYTNILKKIWEKYLFVFSMPSLKAKKSWNASTKANTKIMKLFLDQIKCLGNKKFFKFANIHEIEPQNIKPRLIALFKTVFPNQWSVPIVQTPDSRSNDWCTDGTGWQVMIRSRPRGLNLISSWPACSRPVDGHV